MSEPLSYSRPWIYLNLQIRLSGAVMQAISRRNVAIPWQAARDCRRGSILGATTRYTLSRKVVQR